MTTITYKVVVYAPAERAVTLPPISTLPLYVLCGHIKSVDQMRDCRALSTHNSLIVPLHKPTIPQNRKYTYVILYFAYLCERCMSKGKTRIRSEPEFVNLLKSPGIDSQPGGTVRQIYRVIVPGRQTT